MASASLLMSISDHKPWLIALLLVSASAGDTQWQKTIPVAGPQPATHASPYGELDYRIASAPLLDPPTAGAPPLEQPTAHLIEREIAVEEPMHIPFLVPPIPPARPKRFAPNQDEIFDEVNRIAQAEGVPTFLAQDIIKQESRYDPTVTNGRAMGLGQIKCATARGVGFRGDCHELLAVKTNLVYSMRYLRQALDLAHGDFCHAATLYNRGFATTATTSSYCDSLVRTMRAESRDSRKPLTTTKKKRKVRHKGEAK